jgi:hypothetical protein
MAGFPYIDEFRPGLEIGTSPAGDFTKKEGKNILI